ncbi:glycine zipper family protein [Gordonia sp. NPDC003585]|uniref:glycine zipper family protein n=1 Tax=Gordonia sp. NPDC003585 TaxID=3154275 RepID=UPI0033B5CA13
MVSLVLIAAVFAQWAATGTRAAAAPRGVGVVVTMHASSVTFALENGSAQVRAGRLTILNRTGTDIGQVPLSYRLENRQFPIAVRVVGRTVTLIPVRDVARSTVLNPRDVARVRGVAGSKPNRHLTRQERDDQALARFNQQLAAGMSISALVGLTVGAIVGGTVGCLLGLVAAVVGCLVAVAPAAGVGSVVGTILGGGGTAVIAGFHYFQTITSPFRR